MSFQQAKCERNMTAGSFFPSDKNYCLRGLKEKRNPEP